MKKILIIFIIASLIIGLVWFFRNPSSELSLTEFVQQLNDNIAELTEEERQEAIRLGREQGFELSFLSDGSIRMEHEDGIAVINPDGSWVVDDDVLGHVQIAGNFPINDLTQLIPTPSFSHSIVTGDETSYTIIFHDVALAQIKRYVEQVRAYGFTINVEERVQDRGDMQLLIFRAQNSNGNAIEVSYSSNIATITIRRP